MYTFNSLQSLKVFVIADAKNKINGNVYLKVSTRLQQALGINQMLPHSHTTQLLNNGTLFLSKDYYSEDISLTTRLLFINDLDPIQLVKKRLTLML